MVRVELGSMVKSGEGFRRSALRGQCLALGLPADCVARLYLECPLETSGRFLMVAQTHQSIAFVKPVHGVQIASLQGGGDYLAAQLVIDLGQTMPNRLEVLKSVLRI